MSSGCNISRLYIMSRCKKIVSLGVLPLTKNKPFGSTPRVSSGINISRLYIISRSLPVYKNSFFGSTFAWYSRKSGPTLCFFSTGVLPEALQHLCGSTPKSKSGRNHMQFGVAQYLICERPCITVGVSESHTT